MKIRIATCPCSWGVWMPDGGPSGVPYEMFLQQAEESGYQEIELGPDGYLPVSSGKLKEELKNTIWGSAPVRPPFPLSVWTKTPAENL